MAESESNACDVSLQSHVWGQAIAFCCVAVLLGSAGDFGLLGEVVLSLSLSLSAGRACQSGAGPGSSQSHAVSFSSWLDVWLDAVATKQEYNIIIEH